MYPYSAAVTGEGTWWIGGRGEEIHLSSVSCTIGVCFVHGDKWEPRPASFMYAKGHEASYSRHNQLPQEKIGVRR